MEITGKLAEVLRCLSLMAHLESAGCAGLTVIGVRVVLRFFASAASAGAAGCCTVVASLLELRPLQGSLPEFERGKGDGRSNVALTPAAALVF